jgi:hypothetical protein
MWLMIRNKYFKYEVDPFKTQEVTVKNNIFKEIQCSRGDKSENSGTRVMNIVT